MRAIENTVGLTDAYFCERLRDRLISNKKVEPDVPSFLHAFAETTLPVTLWGFGITLTQCHERPLTVVRMGNPVPSENIRGALNVMQSHRRLRRFLLCDPRVCTMTLDFISNPPTPANLEFAHGLPALIESHQGLRIVGGSDRLYVFPWQWHSLGLYSREAFTSRLTEHFAGRDPATLVAFSFESIAFQKLPSGWSNPMFSCRESECGGEPLTRSPQQESDARPSWEHLRSVLATQHADGWLGSQRMATNWRVKGLQVTDADFARHCQAVVELVDYCEATNDTSIIPQVTAAIDCVFRYVERYLKQAMGVSDQWLCAADTFPQVVRMVQVYQSLTFDYQYTDRLEQLRERTCPTR